MRTPTWLILIVGATFGLVACGGGNVDTTQTTMRQAQESAKDAFASWRTQAERFVDDLQARQAPEVKQRLLDQCRDTLERLRKADSNASGKVDDLCNRIRDTNPDDVPSWNQIRQELSQLNVD